MISAGSRFARGHLLIANCQDSVNNLLYLTKTHKSMFIKRKYSYFLSFIVERDNEFRSMLNNLVASVIRMHDNENYNII